MLIYFQIQINSRANKCNCITNIPNQTRKMCKSLYHRPKIFVIRSDSPLHCFSTSKLKNSSDYFSMKVPYSQFRARVHRFIG